MLHQTSGRIHNKNVSTHLIGNIKRGESRVGHGKLLRVNITLGRKEAGLSLISSPVPPSLPLAVPHPMCSILALTFMFSSSGTSVPPAGHTPENGGSGLFALCTLDGEFPGSAMGQLCAWGSAQGSCPTHPSLPFPLQGP